MIDVPAEGLSPNAFWLLKYTLKPSVRYIVMFGGSSSGKSFSAAQILSLLTYYEGGNTLVMRKVGASIEKTIYADFKSALSGIESLSEKYNLKQNSIVFKNKSETRIDFSGLDDPEKIKGISNYKRVFLDELSEFDEQDFKQIRLRLRGMEGQQIIAAFNPISEEHWIKKKWFDRETWNEIPMALEFDGEPMPPEYCAVKSVKMNSAKQILNPNTGEYDLHEPDTIVIQSTYLNNFWVVGSPDGTYGFYDYQAIANFENDRIHDPDYYQVYALGEWGHIRTGAEFFPSFNRGVVCGKFPYNGNLPIHISMDSNVLPYVTATFFQKEYKPDDVQQVTQFDELPIESPNNSARKAAKVIADRLRSYDYTDKVYLHGDASGKAKNTIDENNRSFFDLVIDELEHEGFDVVDCIGKKNPSVATTGEFINAVWDGRVDKVAIRIDNDCTTSIDDYQAVQKDENGAIAKTKVTNPVTKQKYEAHGHCFVGDTMVITDNGLVPIMNVKIGDKVLTRFGFSEVYNSLCTSRNTRYFFVTLCDKTLRCTYDHPIYTSRGFIPAYQLKVGDEIVTIKNGKQCNEKLQRTTVTSSIAILMQNVRAIGDTLKAGLRLMANGEKSHSTATFGLSSVAKFPKAIAYITLMAMSITTQSATLLLCWLTTMLRIMARPLLKNASSVVHKCCERIAERLQRGMVHKKGLNGTRKTQRSKWRNVNIGRTIASAVAKSFKAVRYKVANSAGIIANQSGEETKDLTMWSALAQYAALNLLSISTLGRSVVAHLAPLSIGGRADVYDISVEDAEFFADGVLVHNCSDTLRYAVYDLLRAQYTEFSMGRKRSLYSEGEFKFFNPATEYDYVQTIVYTMPSFGNRFVLARLARIADRWHLTDVCLRDVKGNDEMGGWVRSFEAQMYVVECQQAYFPMVRDLRKDLPQVNVLKMGSDHRVRISAMSDWVRAHVHINPEKMSEPEYGAFINDVLDYNDQSTADQSAASAVLSGLARIIIRGV